MKRILTIFVAVAAIASGLAVPAHALTPSQSAAVAAKARADALARARAQAAARARADAAVKARADAAKSKALAAARHNVKSETERRTEAAEKAAQAQMQIRTANVQPQVKPSGTQTKAQTPSKLQVRQVQPLRGAAHPQYAQTVKPHPSTGRASGQTSKSSAHAR
jgi:colicin import membrane protein